MRNSITKIKLKINTPSTPAEPQDVFAGQTKSANIGTKNCMIAAIKNVRVIQFGFKREMILPTIITKNIVIYNKFAGLFSLPIIPIAPLAQKRKRVVSIHIHKAMRYVFLCVSMCMWINFLNSEHSKRVTNFF